MANKIKLGNNNYLDTTSIVHNEELLNNFLNKSKLVNLRPNITGQTNWLHYCYSSYRASGQIQLKNNNQIGILVGEIAGWSVSGVSIMWVYGIKF